MARIVQRGAANLRLAELQTALTIPPRATRLHNLLEISAVRAPLAVQPIRSKLQLLQMLEVLVDQRMIVPSVLQEVSNYPEQAILQAVTDVLSGSIPSSVLGLRLQELRALRHAAEHGAPALPSPTPGAPPLFEVIQAQVRSVAGPAGRPLRITPVSRLRMVMVQTGYRRLDPLNPPVDRFFQQGPNSWYPGVELSGEGVYVDLEPGPGSGGQAVQQQLSGAAANAWFDAWIDPDGAGQHIPTEEQNQLHPVFVWWHTLSHRLINALAVDSGYSSAAVRERVFVDVDQHTGEAAGGVLLYTAQAGGDGTLGGMIALVPEFEFVLSAAFRNLDSCSNDPLCGEESFGPGKCNGAACYACSLVSETSCEHRNMRLDRRLLLDNLP